MDILKQLAMETPVIRDLLLLAYRGAIGSKYFFRPLPYLLNWLFKSKETTNFTYNLREKNKRYLASLIAEVTGKTYNEIMGYIQEIENDVQLKEHIQEMTKHSPKKFVSDSEARYGRRIGWYAFVRALKPKIVVETGIDKGLGSCIITSALIRNEQEQYPGYYYGTDINPIAGYLFSGKYKQYGEILYGDSIESLKNFNQQIDLFINDSDHSADYEEKEYEIIKDKLSANAIVLGDNSNVTDKLLNFALATNKKFLYFQEEPQQHWYPGDGIGIAYPKN